MPPQALARIAALADEAVETVAGRFFERFPAAYESFGERGRTACREDIRFHLDYLVPALEYGSPRPFADYARWLAIVLESRSVPSDHLGISFDWLGEFLSARLPAAEAQPALAVLDQAKRALGTAGEPPYLRGMPAAWPQCEPFTEAIVRGDARSTAEIFRDASSGGERFADAALHVVQPAMYEVGLRWQDNRVSVAQEHLATAIVSSVMAREMGKAPVAPANGRRIVLACAEGNHHALGLRFVADAFELAGWETDFLGEDTPTRALVDLVASRPPDVIALSVSLPMHLRPTRRAIAAVRERLGAACPPVLVGGIAVNQFPGIATGLGADLSAPDAAAALRAVEAPPSA